MIPTREELQEIVRARSGSLREKPFAAVIEALAVHQMSGVLEIRRNQLEKKIVFEEGIPVDCRSNLVHETLGRFMVSKGRLTEPEMNAALASSAAKGVPFGQVLIDEGRLSPVELFRILQQNLAKKLLDGFTWRDGEFRVSSEMPAVPSPLRVRVPQLVVTGISKYASQDEVDTAIVPLIGKRLALHPYPRFAVEELRLSQGQSRLLDLMAQGRRIDELAEGSDVPIEEISRFVYALAVLGVVLTADQVSKVTPPPNYVKPEAAKAVTPPPAASASQPPARSAAEADRIRNEVTQAFLAHRSQDAFDILGLQETASLPDIQSAFLRFSSRFAPWQFQESELQAVAERAQDLFFSGAKAFGVLTDSEQRNTLIHRRRTLREEQRRSASANRFVLKTDLLDPEVQYRKGRAAMESGKYREAISFFEFASDCDPQNGVYRADLAYARFRNSPTLVTGSQCLKELKEAMRIDPECGLAAFYAGEIHRESGNAAEAEPLLRKAAKLMAPDRRPVDALKALAGMAKR